MTLAAQRTAIFNVVDGVTDAGQVYDYGRWANDWGTFINLFKTTVSGTSQIRGWEVVYQGQEPRREVSQFGHTFHRVHRWQIAGYMGIDDSAATEKTFSNLAEDVCDALDADATLHDTSTYYDVSEANIVTFEARMFSDVLAHYAEITLEIWEQESA